MYFFCFLVTFSLFASISLTRIKQIIIINHGLGSNPILDKNNWFPNLFFIFQLNEYH